MTAWQVFMPNHLHKLFLESFLCNIFEKFPQNDMKIRVLHSCFGNGKIVNILLVLIFNNSRTLPSLALVYEPVLS